MASLQQINLYQAEFRKQTPVMSSTQLLQFSGLVVLLCILGTAYLYWNASQLESRLQAQQDRQQSLMSELAATRAQLATRKQDETLVKQVSRLEAELVRKQAVLNILTGQAFGNREGFDAYFTGLARQRVEGLWLTQVQIQQGGTRLALRGSATRAEYIPQYLQRLADEAVFVGTSFDTVAITQNETKSSWVDFDLQSQLVGGQYRSQP